MDVSKVKSIAVIGDNATRKLTIGGGSSELKSRYEVSPLQGITKRFADKLKISYSQGYDLKGNNSDSLFHEAVQLAVSSDFVLFFGGLNKEPGQDSEGADRKDMKLPYGQDSLISALAKANPNLAVILITGNAVEMPWIDQVPALLQSWYPGLEGGNALAAILCGDVNPSGKLPFTIPVRLQDCPAHAMGAYPGNGITVNYAEDIYVGYRWFNTKKIKPQFSFGFGLSYTSFVIGKALSDKNEIYPGDSLKFKIQVKNTGIRTGSEIVQLYLSSVNPVEDRPLKELKAFKKVNIQSGGEKTVNLKLTYEDFRMYSQKEDRWKTVPGDYRILIGNSVDNIVEELNIVVK